MNVKKLKQPGKYRALANEMIVMRGSGLHIHSN